MQGMRRKIHDSRLLELEQVRKGGGIGPRRAVDRRIIASGKFGRYEVRLHATKGFRVRAA